MYYNYFEPPDKFKNKITPKKANNIPVNKLL